MTPGKPVTVLIVDDHPVVRDGLNAMLSAEADISVVGEAGTGNEALALVSKLRPAVVLMDLLLPDIEGSQVIQGICSRSSDTAFIVLTPVEGERNAQNLSRPDLSSREIQVLQLIAAGLRNKEIAYELDISEATANAHVKHILEKLSAADRTQAVTTALRRGII